VQRLELVEHSCALAHAGALRDQQRCEYLACAAGTGCGEPVVGEDLLRGHQCVDLIRLSSSAVLASGTLDLHNSDPFGQEVLAKPGSIAACALDPDHNLSLERPEPLHQLGVAGEARVDGQAAQQLPEPIESPGEVLMLVGVYSNCNHRLSPHRLVGDVEAVGQSCVERCQASMKSRRHPDVVATGDGSTQRHQYGPAVTRVIPPPPAPSRGRRTPPRVVFSTHPTGSLRRRLTHHTHRARQAHRTYTAIILVRWFSLGAWLYSYAATSHCNTRTVGLPERCQ
jgi:hypothetical protein